MARSKPKPLYKVIFFNHGKVYELFSQSVGTSGLWGFVEVADLVFETGEGLVVDPTEEKMRQEFAGASVTVPFEPYTPQEVGALRQHPLNEVMAYRAQLLADIASAK